MVPDVLNELSILQNLAEDVRTKTLRMFDSANEDELTWTPPGLSNHILWYAGHALWLQDTLCIEAITGQSEMPAGWYEKFSMRCRPPRETKVWPHRSEIRERLKAQLPRVVSLIGSLSESDLRGPARAASLAGTGSLGYWVMHGLHDEANHQGEMHLLLKIQRAARR